MRENFNIIAIVIVKGFRRCVQSSRQRLGCGSRALICFQATRRAEVGEEDAIFLTYDVRRLNAFHVEHVPCACTTMLKQGTQTIV